MPNIFNGNLPETSLLGILKDYKKQISNNVNTLKSKINYLKSQLNLNSDINSNPLLKIKEDCKRKDYHKSSENKETIELKNNLELISFSKLENCTDITTQYILRKDDFYKTLRKAGASEDDIEYSKEISYLRDEKEYLFGLL